MDENNIGDVTSANTTDIGEASATATASDGLSINPDNITVTINGNLKINSPDDELINLNAGGLANISSENIEIKSEENLNENSDENSEEAQYDLSTPEESKSRFAKVLGNKLIEL